MLPWIVTAGSLLQVFENISTQLPRTCLLHRMRQNFWGSIHLQQCYFCTVFQEKMVFYFPKAPNNILPGKSKSSFSFLILCQLLSTTLWDCIGSSHTGFSLFSFWDRTLLCNLDWPRTLHLPDSASCVLEWQVYTTIPDSQVISGSFPCLAALALGKPGGHPPHPLPFTAPERMTMEPAKECD
jgi:hypothetical protein